MDRQLEVRENEQDFYSCVRMNNNGECRSEVRESFSTIVERVVSTGVMAVVSFAIVKSTMSGVCV